MDTIEPIAEFETWWSEAVKKALADCDATTLTDDGEEIDLKTMMQLGTSAKRKRYSPETRMQAYYCILDAFAQHARDDVYVSIERYRADIIHFWKDKEPSKRRFFPWKWKKTAPTEEVDPNPWRLAEIIHIEWAICDWRIRLDDALDIYKCTGGFNSLKTMMDAGSADTVDEYEESYRREACRIIRDHVVSSAPKYVSETITTVGDAYISDAKAKKAEETEPAVWFANPWRVRDRAAYTWRWFPQGKSPSREEEVVVDEVDEVDGHCSEEPEDIPKKRSSLIKALRSFKRWIGQPGSESLEMELEEQVENVVNDASSASG